MAAESSPNIKDQSILTSRSDIQPDIDVPTPRVRNEIRKDIWLAPPVCEMILL